MFIEIYSYSISDMGMIIKNYYGLILIIVWNIFWLWLDYDYLVFVIFDYDYFSFGSFDYD